MLFKNVYASSGGGGGRGRGRLRLSSDGGEVQRGKIPRDIVLERGQQAQREALNALMPRNRQRRRRNRMPRG